VGSSTRLENSKDPAPAAGTRFETHKSLGLNALLQVLEDERPYSLLDLGPAHGANVDFLSKFCCKIRIEDLYPTLLTAGFFDRRELPVDGPLFEKLLHFPADARFDIILSWGLFDYLESSDIRALVKYLSGFCRSGAFLFALSSNLKEIPSSPTSFMIQDRETLIYTSDSARLRPSPRYAPRDLINLMSGFRAYNSFLLRNGMQEYLFVRE
jgi:hypothetical protein